MQKPVIAKIEIRRTRKNGWPVYWVRTLRDTGTCANRYKADSVEEARSYAKGQMREHGLSFRNIEWV